MFYQFVSKVWYFLLYLTEKSTHIACNAIFFNFLNKLLAFRAFKNNQKFANVEK